MLNLETICSQVVDLARSTGEYIYNERSNIEVVPTESKGRNDFVTHFDKLAEQILVDGLRMILPESGFITEENTAVSNGEELTWIIDPIDGTTNFIHGLAPYCISIALKRDQEVVLGVIYELANKEAFYAWEGSKSYLNGSSISVSAANNVADSLVATGFSLGDYENSLHFYNTLLYFSKNTHGLRRSGSAAANLAYVACGRLDGFYKLRLKAWDVAAGVLIIKQAGGKVSDFSGGDNYLFGGELVATNDLIHQEMLHLIKNSFKDE